MKKVFLFAVAAVALSLASCANKGGAENSNSSDSIPAPEVVIENSQVVVADSAANDSLVIDEVAVGEVAPASK